MHKSKSTLSGMRAAERIDSPLPKDSDVASVARRAEVARELWTAVSVVGFGKLLLSAPEHASVQLRCELLSLADALSQGLAGASATLSVRFGGPIDGRVDAATRYLHPPSAEPQSGLLGTPPHGLGIVG